MDSWLRLVGQAVSVQVEGIEMFWVDDETLSLALGTRGVVLHATGDVAFMAPSFEAGGTKASGLQDQVRHFNPVQYAIDEGTVGAASDAIVAHLWRSRFVV